MALDSPPRERPISLTLLPLGLVFLAVGLSTAVVGPFLSLFLSTDVHAGPVRVTLFLIATPLAGVAISNLLSRYSDRHPVRRKLLIAASTAGAVGAVLAVFIRDYWVLLGVSVTAFALATTLFPQSFAYARQILTRDSPGRAAMGVSSLRTVFSLAWVAGPPLAGLLLALGGFAYVYAMAAITYAIAALVAVFWLAEVDAPAAVHEDDVRNVAEPDAPRHTLWLTVAAFTLLQAPLNLGVQALPLYISQDLGGRVSDAGLLLGLCAFLEIPLMLGLGLLTTKVRLRLLLLIGAVCGVAYEVLAVLSTSVGMLAAGQLLNAIFIASVSGLGITYMQNMLPRHPGRAATLFSSSFPIGALLAGPFFGLSQHFGFRLAFILNAALCVLGLILLFVVKPQPRAVKPQPRLVPSPE